jgi:Na+-driven multidrug efflux pump
MYLNKKYNIGILLKGYIVKRILEIGLPAGLQSVMFSFTNIISQVYINNFGTDYVTAWTVYTKIGVVFFTIITAYGVAVTTFVGQNYGADRKERLWRGVKSGLCISYLSTIVISTIYLLFKRQLLMLFTRDENVLKLGAEVVKCIVPLYFTYVAMELLIGALKGLGKSFVPMCMTAFGVCFLRVVWLVFIQPKYNDFRMIVWSLPIGWIITSILIIAYYLFIKTKIRLGVKNEF